MALWVVFSAGVLYTMPAPRSIAAVLLGLLGFAAGLSEVVIHLYARRERHADQPTTLNLNH